MNESTIDKPIEDYDYNEKENLIENNLEKLQEYFINLKEFGGVPIIKDNCDDLFENWIEALNSEDIRNILLFNNR